MLQSRKYEGYEIFLTMGFDLIKKQMSAHFDEMTPDAARKIECMEAVLVEFVYLTSDFERLQLLEESIYDTTGARRELM